MLDLDIYRRMVEGQLRPWCWALLQVFGRTAAKAPELSSLREQLIAEQHPLLLDAARAILPDARNAAAHEDYVWDDRLGVLRIGDAEISPDDLDDASDRAYTFMLGAEAAWRCARHSSPAGSNTESTVKTIAIKVEDELHAQLLLIAQLEGTTLTDVIRQAVEQSVESLRSGEGLAAKAQDLLNEIEQETATRKQAVQNLLSKLGDKSTSGPKRSRRSGAAQEPS